MKLDPDTVGSFEKKAVGRLPGSSDVVEVEWDNAITAVDELIGHAGTVDYLTAGLIDLQINGFAGVDYNDPSTTRGELAASLRTMFSTGVTRCFPTIITGSQERMSSCLRNLSEAKEEFARANMPEAQAISGFHVEGPHISPVDGPRGAHPREHVRPPDLEEFKRLQEAADGGIRLVTLSPEWAGAPAFIDEVVRMGVVASIGHTQATAAQVRAAVEAGATMSTHLGNGSHATLHKTDNYLWDQLADDRLSAGFVVDGIHLPGHFLRAALRAKGIQNAFLVTDAVMPAMCVPGFYDLGQVAVELLANGSVVLRGGTRLAGSALRMDYAISNTVRLGGISLRDALTMATVNPARAGRIAGRQRGLSNGEKADLIRFQWDEQSQRMTVLETVLAGELVYRA